MSLEVGVDMHPRKIAGENTRPESPLSFASSVKKLTVCVIALAGLASARAQAVPAAVASSSRQVLASFPNPAVGRVATNSAGDALYVNGTYSNNSTVNWLKRGSTTPTIIASISGSGARNAYVDANNNLFVPNLYSANIIEIPYVNGAYPTVSNVSSLAICASYAPTTPCLQFLGNSANQPAGAANYGYYMQPYDIGIDAAGDAYVLQTNTNGNCTVNCIVKFTPNNDAGGTYTASIAVSGLAPNNQYANGQIAVDPAGDVFYVNGAVLETLAAGTKNAVAFGVGFTNPAGASTDSYGNLYITNSSSPYGIFEFPVLNKVVQTGEQFPILSTYSNTGVGVDTEGDVYYVGYSGGPNLNVAAVNAIPVGSAVVGSPVSGGATSITFSFSTSTMVSGIYATGSGFAYSAGSCAAGATYATNGSCTVNVTYTPTAVGLQRGAISLTSTAGSAIASALLSGIGLGAAETNDPGTVTAIGSGFISPTGIAVDASGNVYIADPGQNAVLRYAGGTGTPTSIGTGLSKPTAVRLDNAGNVYIADGGNGRVVMVPNNNGTLTNAGQTVVIGNLGSNLGLAFDFLGNLYISDRSSTAITELLNIGGLPRASATVSLTIPAAASSTPPFVMPSALATDPSGNLFVADYGKASLTEFSFLGKVVTAVGGGLAQPTGVASDASGSLYIADAGNRVIKFPLEGAAFNTNDEYMVNSTVVAPYGVALDGAANLYIVDSTNATANLVNRTSGSLPLGRAQIMTTTSAQNANIGNSGNQPLIFGAVPYTQTSTTPTYFTVTSPSGTGCVANGTVAQGRSCALSATFSPQTTGNFSDLLTFTTNAVNGTPSTLNLTGKGLNLATDTLVLTQTAGAATFGSPVTIQAAVSSSVAGTPTGTVTFSVDGNNQANSPAVMNGVATITLNGLTGGSHQVCGSYTGDDNYRPSNSCITVVVAKVGTTTTLTIVGASTMPLTSTLGSPSTLTATVVASASTPPTGTVTFTAGGVTLGMAPVTASSGGYTAVLTTSNLPAGAITVTATYNGDVNYNPSSGSLGDIVTYPTFVLSPSATSTTVSTNGVATLNLTVTALAGFSGTIGLQCTGLPTNTVCTFSPNPILLQNNTPQVVTMQVLTGQPVVVGQPVIGGVGLPGAFGSLAFIALTVLLFTRNRKVTFALRGRLLSLLALALTGMLLGAATGCGGSGFVGVTPKGTYNVTISAVGTNSATTYTAAGNASGCTLTAGVSTCTEPATLTLVVQ